MKLWNKWYIDGRACKLVVSLIEIAHLDTHHLVVGINFRFILLAPPFHDSLPHSDANKANSVKARQYKAKARGLQGQGLTLQRMKSRS